MDWRSGTSRVSMVFAPVVSFIATRSSRLPPLCRLELLFNEHTSSGVPHTGASRSGASFEPINISSFQLCSYLSLRSSVETGGWRLELLPSNWILKLVSKRYLRLPSFLSPEETIALLERSKQLLEAFNVDDHPLVRISFVVVYASSIDVTILTRLSSLPVKIITWGTNTFSHLVTKFGTSWKRTRSIRKGIWQKRRPRPSIRLDMVRYGTTFTVKSMNDLTVAYRPTRTWSRFPESHIGKSSNQGSCARLAIPPRSRRWGYSKAKSVVTCWWNNWSSTIYGHLQAAPNWWSR